jgi:hypothetical protein
MILKRCCRMKKADKEQSLKEIDSKSSQDLYGLEPIMSLQSVHFAPSENPLLNEHFEGEDKQCD